MTANQIARTLQDHGFSVSVDRSHRRFTKNGVMLTLPLSSHGSSAPWVVSGMKSAIRRAEEAGQPKRLSQDLPSHRKITAGEAKPGRAVKALRPFVGVPAGTVGKIEEDYGSGFFVAWANGIRDAFDKARELRWLGVVA